MSIKIFADPYFQRRRLRDLASPRELFRLQIAAGEFALKFGPRIKCKTTHPRCGNYMIKKNKNGKLEFYQFFGPGIIYDHHPLGVNTIRMINVSVSFNNLTAEDFDDPAFDHLIINSESVYFDGATTEPVLRKISTLYMKPIRFINGNLFASPTTIATLFPKLFHLDKLYVYGKWVKEFIRNNVSGLDLLHVYFYNMNTFYETTSKEMYKFIKMQLDNEFTLFIEIEHVDPEDLDTLDKKILRHFKSHFRRQARQRYMPIIIGWKPDTIIRNDLILELKSK